MIAALLLATALLTNARVNDPAQTPAGAPDITPAVAVLGNEVLVVWSVRGPNPTDRLRWARSSNGGQSWTDQGWLPNPPTGWRWGIDPCVEADPVTNRFFVAAQAANPGASQQGIAFVSGQLSGSTLTWGTPGIVQLITYAGSYLGDNLSLHFDPATVSLDLVFQDGWASPAPLTHIVSTDRGATWSTPTILASDPGAQAGQHPKVAYDFLYGPIVLYLDGVGSEAWALRSRRSLSPGVFEPPVTLDQRVLAQSTLPGTVADFLNGITIAADHTGFMYDTRIYAAWVGGNEFSGNPVPPGGTVGELEPNDSQATATAIGSGTGYMFSAFSPPTEADWYTIALAAGEHLIIRSSGMTLTGTQGVVTITTWTPDGLHDLGTGSFNSASPGTSIRFTAPRAATYAFKVTGFNVSNYQLNFARWNQEPWLGLDRRDVWTSFSRDLGVTWSAPSRWPTPPGFDSALPQIAMGNDGRPYLFYLDFDAGNADGTTSVLKARRSSNGGETWEQSVTISSTATDWQPIPIVGSPYKSGWRIAAATTPPVPSEQSPGRGADPSRAQHAASEQPGERMVVVWPDGRDGEVNLYSASFPTGFDIPFRITDTTATPGTALGLRAIMENRNPLFPLYVDPLPAVCQRNWSSAQNQFFLNPGETRSFWPIVVNVPDTAAAGDVFFQGAFTIGTTNYGINTMIHVVPVVGVGDAPRAIAFRTSGPNPASGSTSFDFTLPADSEASLEVFDVTGARVRSLVAGRVAAGAHEQRWDLSDDAGRRVGTGLYLARLTIGGWSRTCRITVVR
jgi:hypothetical protein